MSLATSIDRHFVSVAGYAELSRQQKDRINTLTIDYIFRGINKQKYAAQFATVMPKYDRTQWNAARMGMLQDAKVMRHLKIYLVERSQKERVRSKGVSAVDKNIWNTLTVRQRNQIKKFTENVVTSERDLSQLSLYCWKKTQVFARKFIYRKMRFIMDMRPDWDFEAINSHLVAEMLQALLFSFQDLETLTHAENFAKQIIRNTGHNLIKELTCERNKMVTENRELATLSLDHEYTTDTDNGVVTLFDTGVFATKFDLELVSFSRYLESLSDRKRNVFCALLGVPSAEFTGYIRHKQITMRQNDVWSENAEPRLVFETACDFYGVKEHRRDRMFEQFSAQIEMHLREQQ